MSIDRGTQNAGMAADSARDLPRPATRAPASSVHLPFLDGLRGAAALYVALFHVFTYGDETLALTGTPLDLLRFGHEAVVVFIVLSGFVLTLPVVRAPRLALKGGLRGFFARRAWRIGPGYYAALLLLPAYHTAMAVVSQLAGNSSGWATVVAQLTSADMVSHLLLVHNLSHEWAYSINPILWSISTEWWIYVVFALLLLPLWRRRGLGAAFTASVALGLVPVGLGAMGWPTLSGFPHLLGAFGLGMVAAAWCTAHASLAQASPAHSGPGHPSPVVGEQPDAASRESSRDWPFLRAGSWRVAGLLALLAFVGMAVAAPSLRLGANTRWVTDSLVAIVCASAIVAGAADGAAPARFGLTRLFRRVLETRPLAWLGAISYSLYLTHLAFWAILGMTLQRGPLARLFPPDVINTWNVRVLIVLPLLILGAYGFYLLFERPFLPSAMRRRAQADTVPATAAAPSIPRA